MAIDGGKAERRVLASRRASYSAAATRAAADAGICGLAVRTAYDLSDRSAGRGPARSRCAEAAAAARCDYRPRRSGRRGISPPDEPAHRAAASMGHWGHAEVRRE